MKCRGGRRRTAAKQGRLPLLPRQLSSHLDHGRMRGPNRVSDFPGEGRATATCHRYRVRRAQSIRACTFDMHPAIAFLAVTFSRSVKRAMPAEPPTRLVRAPLASALLHAHHRQPSGPPDIPRGLPTITAAQCRRLAVSRPSGGNKRHAGSHDAASQGQGAEVQEERIRSACRGAARACPLPHLLGGRRAGR